MPQLCRYGLSTDVLHNLRCYAAKHVGGQKMGILVRGKAVTQIVVVAKANCTHVWHYAQSHARLLPELGRIMREQDYDMQFEDGLLPYRHNNTKPAADGHFGTILNTYREHLCSKDNKWLEEQWPRVKKAIEWGSKSGILSELATRKMNNTIH
ncbi:hypothetical protein [Psychrosphaera algicola]|uniref:Uncharacterized protein n=1 Tax=Psychrosphaera algicola TaxID=3023714 RepID=A0ABT5FBN9_9GAMM|nr:hypothetical protein [Psychrosphaera sp. G1-22]MDC2888559.1 hypothetical protein [Psychrosphaera sp. G1-22]